MERLLDANDLFEWPNMRIRVNADLKTIWKEIEMASELRVE